MIWHILRFVLMVALLMSLASFVQTVLGKAPHTHTEKERERDKGVKIILIFAGTESLMLYMIWENDRRAVSALGDVNEVVRGELNEIVV